MRAHSLGTGKVSVDQFHNATDAKKTISPHSHPKIYGAYILYIHHTEPT